MVYEAVEYHNTHSWTGSTFVVLLQQLLHCATHSLHTIRHNVPALSLSCQSLGFMHSSASHKSNAGPCNFAENQTTVQQKCIKSNLDDHSAYERSNKRLTGKHGHHISLYSQSQ